MSTRTTSQNDQTIVKNVFTSFLEENGHRTVIEKHQSDTLYFRKFMKVMSILI